MFLIMIVRYTVCITLAPFNSNIIMLLTLRVLQGIAVAVIPLSTKMVRDV
jgi:MFS family permease